jgi:glycerophosphoryl diester phosphodiesterase
VKGAALALATLFTAEAFAVEPGSRPLDLIATMTDSPLKTRLEACRDGPFERTTFSIGHRGAPLQFPEHTLESYIAAAGMGAGILECDVTFTRDGHLVCRHAQCDLHQTTNILATDLAEICAVPFTPAANSDPARALCCASDITLAEFKSLCGWSGGVDASATTLESYIRADTEPFCGTVLSHAESIDLFEGLGVGFIPELKASSVATPNGAQQVVDAYVAAGIPPDRVWPQSFNLDDVRYWIENTDYGDQAVYLDGRYADETFDHADPETWKPSMEELAEMGVNIIAPPMWMLLALDGDRIVPSAYARAAKAAGLAIITWTLERSGSLEFGGGWYYQTIAPAIDDDGDMLTVLDILAQDVGVIGVFSDWPGTVTYYANCMANE